MKHLIATAVMNHFVRLVGIALPVLLVACGGGGGGSTAGTGGNDRVESPIEFVSVGGFITTIGGDNGVAPLSGLSSFTPSITSPTMQAVREIDLKGEHHVMLTLSEISELGSCCKIIGILPGDDGQLDAYFSKFFNMHDAIELPLPMTDLSLVHPNAPSCRVSCVSRPPEDYFADSTYRSRTSSTAIIGDVNFARGSLTATRAHDNTLLEFQTFAGWFDGRIFTTKQILIGESGSKQYRFISYYLASADRYIDPDYHHSSFYGGTTPSGTGSAIWEGVAVASIKDVAAIEHGWSFIRGDATIDIDDLTNPDVDLRFDNWHLIDGREVLLPVIIFEGAEINRFGNFISFNDDLPSLNGFRRPQAEGVFHGDNQEAVGGTFETKTLAGAFAGVRQ